MPFHAPERSGLRVPNVVPCWPVLRSCAAKMVELEAQANPRGDRMHLIILMIFVGLAAVIVWVADWTTVPGRRATAVDILNRRLARGEIDRTEYEEKRKVLGR